MDSAYLKFSSSKELGEESEVFSTAFNSVLITSLFYSCIISLLKNPLMHLFSIEEINGFVIYLVSGILFFDAISNIVFSRLRFHNRAFKFALIKSLNIIVNVFLNVYLIYFKHLGPAGVFYANLGASIITLFFLIPDLFKGYKPRLDRSIFSGLLKFGLPFVPAGFASIITQVIDRPILLALTDASTVGVYQANYKLGIFMMLFVSMFQYAWQPFYLKQAQLPGAKEIFSKIFTYFTGITFFLFLILALFIEDIVKIKIFGFYLIGKNFWVGLYIVPIVLLGYVFNGWYVNFLAGIQIEKKTQYMPLVSGLGALVNIAANLLLIPLMGMLGAAYATLFAYASMAIYQYFLSQRFYKISYEWRKIFLLCLTLTIVYVGYFASKNFLDLPLILIKLVSVIVYIVLLSSFRLINLSIFKNMISYLVRGS